MSLIEAGYVLPNYLIKCLESLEEKRLRRVLKLPTCMQSANLPPERKSQGGRPAKSNRKMLNAMVYWLNTGIPWRDMPERFGPWRNVYSRFCAWTKVDVWENVLINLIQQDIIDGTTLMLDSTSIKVHQHANSVKKRVKISQQDAAGKD